MHKQVLFCLILFSTCIKAQQQPGQVIISAGVGYSPEFNGQFTFFNSQAYPVSINDGIQDFDNGFTCSSILPNLGATVDMGITKLVSLGFAGSYQSETVIYRFTSTFSDKVSRTNGAFRLLFHLNKRSTIIDDYFGVRCGISFWHDVPSIENRVVGSSGGTMYYNTISFLSNTSPLVGSFQVLYGIRVYISDNIAIHFEAGIGSPYLIECGLTYRLNKGNPSKVLKQGSYGGHPIN